MDIQYFKSAWGDIKNSPGWFGKMCLLALLNFIPIFGQIVTAAYLYGWAREIAWGTHEPMPAKIFSNDDGKFWRRGWFVLVLTFVFALVPSIVTSIGNSIQGLGISETFFGQEYVATPAWIAVGSLVSIVGMVLTVVAAVLAWIGNMRVSIYDRLSAGFQLGKIWKMLRRDTGGILRIFGMELLFSLLLGIVLSIVFFVLVFVVVAVGVAGLVNAGYSPEMVQYMTNTQAVRMLVQFVAAAGLVGVFSVIIGSFATMLVGVFVEMLVIRAMGYWTMQFDVPRWGGQDDPLPFELFEDEPVEQAQYRPQPQAAPTAAQQAPVADAAPSAVPGGAPVQQAYPESVVAPVPLVSVPDDSPASAPEPSSDGFEVDYGEPAVVGAEFLMTPEEIEEAQGAAEAGEIDAALDAVASEAQGAHGVEDGQAGDPDVGEDGEPHVGEPEGGEPQD